MAKVSIIERDKKREKLVNRYNQKRNLLKVELKTASGYKEKLKVLKKLQALPPNSAPNRLRNRCWKTGRSRGYIRDFGVSRHVLREMSHECLLPGIKKSSW